MIGSTIISLISLIVSFIAMYVVYKNRLETNRPIVTALLESNAKNIATALTLRLYNTGATPALDITIEAKKEDIEKAFIENAPEEYKKDVFRSLSGDNVIPLILNNSSVQNAFGILSDNENNTFKLKSRIPIVIKYKNLYGHTYKQKQTLIIRITDYFAGSGWEVTK